MVGKSPASGAMALRTRLVVFAGSISLFVLACLAALYVVVAQRMLADEARFEAAGVATDLASVREASERYDGAELQRVFDRFVRESTDIAYVFFVDARTGRVVAGVPRTIVDGARLVPPHVDATAEAAPLRRVTDTTLLSDGACGGRAGEAVVDAAEKLSGPDGAVVGTIRVGVRVARLDGLLARSLPLGAGVAAIVFALALALALFEARRIARPIRALARQMKKVADGELDAKAERAGPRELRELAEAYNGMLVGLRQKLALERYVPALARDEIDGRLSGGGAIVDARQVEAVVLFADLRGFSALSEERTPAEVLSLLNVYSDSMSRVVADNGGDVIELMGDGVLAVFVDDDARAANALRCARAMKAALRAPALASLRVGVGLHAGPVVLGTVGTGDRLKFAVVGDAVNVASRIQEQARDPSGSCVYLSEEVRALAGDGFEFDDAGELQVRGRAGSVHLFRLVPSVA
jgi:class 3 adenylate cyclase